MWIRTQNKQRIINSDQIIDIFIDKTGKNIYAETITKDSFFTLGEYQDRDTCLEILDVLMVVGSHDNVKWIQLPLGGDAESWLEDSHKMAEDIYNKKIYN